MLRPACVPACACLSKHGNWPAADCDVFPDTVILMQAAGVPIYAVKSASATALVKAVRTLVGAEPSAGGYFQTRRDGAESPTAAGEGRAVGGAGRGEDSDSEVEAVHGDEDDGDEEGEEEGEGAAGVEGAALREVAREGAAREGAAVGAGSGNGAVAGPSGPGLGEEEVVEGGAVASAADRSIPGLSAVDAMYLVSSAADAV